MGVWKSIFNNTCKPKGLFGMWMVTGMNHAHAALGDWGIRHLPETGFDQIVELGCGGGRNVKALLRRYPAARITALDYAQIAVEKTKRINEQAIQKGRCCVVQGDVSRLPFRDRQFDLATAFETVYFWPGPDARWLRTIDGLRIYNKEQLIDFLTEAGFSSITVDHSPNMHRLCLLAVRGTAAL